jgi:hypothetical protein
VASDQVVATARKPDQLQDLVDRYGDRVRAVQLDVTDAAAAAVRTTIAVFGHVLRRWPGASRDARGTTSESTITSFMLVSLPAPGLFLATNHGSHPGDASGRGAELGCGGPADRAFFRRWPPAAHVVLPNTCRRCRRCASLRLARGRGSDPPAAVGPDRSRDRPDARDRNTRKSAQVCDGRSPQPSRGPAQVCAWTRV